MSWASSSRVLTTPSMSASSGASAATASILFSFGSSIDSKRTTTWATAVESWGRPSGVLPLMRDVLHVQVKQFGDALAEFRGDGDDLGPVHDEDAVDVDDLVAGERDLLEGGLEEDGGVCAFPLRIARRKEGSDVSGGHGAEERVGDGVEEEVAVGVSGEAFGVIDFEAAEDQRDSGLEGVRVKAETDAHRHSVHPNRSWPGTPSPRHFLRKVFHRETLGVDLMRTGCQKATPGTGRARVFPLSSSISCASRALERVGQ